MRLAHLAAGAGAMYCGACARDAALVRGMLRRGHDVVVLPLYTPLRVEGDEPLPAERVFLGGINAYLQQVSPLFRSTPAWLDRWLDHPALLNWASRFAVSVKPEDLGPMTLSVLEGLEGRQRKELQRILAFLGGGRPFDLVTLTNSMLSGIAPALKERFGLPVACLLQGEETFLEALREPFRSGALQRLRSNARYVDRFIAPGEAYAGAMAEYLGVPRERVDTIRAGIDPTPYRNSQPIPAEPFTIGYLSVIHRPKGLDLLVEAWRILVHEMGREARLVVAGRVMDPRYWREMLEAVDRAGMREAFRFAGEVDRQAKIDLLRGCSVFCVPSRFAESRGIAVLEAQAASVPVVVPNSGIYPEMLALTGGGFLHEPESARSIAERLAHVHDDPGAARAIGCAGAEGVARHFGADAMVAATLAVYEQMVRMRPGAS